MNAHVAIRTGMAAAFNALSGVFLPEVTVALLKISATDDQFELVRTISSKRFFTYSNYRKNALLQIADSSSALTTAMEDATHVAITTPDSPTEPVTLNGEPVTINGLEITIGMGDIYVIRRGDVTPPTGTDPTWKIFVDRFEDSGRYDPL
jgi:hypothetical protein